MACPKAKRPFHHFSRLGEHPVHRGPLRRGGKNGRSSSVKSSSRRPMSELEDAMDEEMKEIGGEEKPGEIMTILFK